MQKLAKNLTSKLAKNRLLSPPFHLRHWKWFRLIVLTGVDVVAIACCYWAAFVLRLDDMRLVGWSDVFLRTLPVVIVMCLLAFKLVGLYRQVWRYANLNSAMMVARGVALGTIAAVAANHLLRLDFMPPRSVPVIFLLLATVAIIVTRFSWRMWASFRLNARASEFRERCLIYGAGSAGEQLARHAVANPKFPYQAIGFIDDDRNKTGRLLHGLKIYGTGQDLRRLVDEHHVATVILAMHAAPGKIVRELVRHCTEAGVKPLIMPNIANSLGTDVIQPRSVDVKDLLRRSPKAIDVVRVGNFFQGQSILVTGAGGSIGAEICRQLLALKPRKLVLFDASEYNLYRVELDLREQGLGNCEIHAVLGSATDRQVVERTFRDHKPSCVLHAAAYKHVAMVESNPLVGLINNVQGTKNVAEIARAHGVRHFLLISTDKAVRPTSVMGSTKRCCELTIQCIQALDAGECQFSAVRFGNVLGSSGSVIPRFLEQIQAGGPVTVTHPDVTRYFMLIPEAVALCLQSMVMASGGEIYVLNMGESIKIDDMARQLVLLAGKEPGKDIEIIYTGLKPGEKLYEELILEGHEKRTLHDDVFVTIPQKIDAVRTLAQINRMLDKAHAEDAAEALRILRRLAFTEDAQGNPVDRSRATSASVTPPDVH